MKENLQRAVFYNCVCAGDADANCITYSILCNTKKTVCMVFNPKCVSKIVSLTFPPFTLCGVKLKFVTNFKYLGHIINNKLSDCDDIEREI